MNIKEIKVDDFFLSPVENLTFSLNKNKTNLLISYPNLIKVEVNSISDFKGDILIDGKKIALDKDLLSLKNEICYINSNLDENLLSGSFYSNLLEAYLTKHNHLNDVYLDLIKEIDEKKEQLNLEKQRLINKENEEYNNLIKKITSSFETKINKLKGKKDEKSLLKIEDLNNSKDSKLKELENEHLYNLKLIDDEFIQQSNIDSQNEKNIIKNAKNKCKNIYKDECKILKDKVKTIKKDKVLNFDEKEDEINKENEKFYLKTYLPKQIGQERINNLLEKLGFNISFYLKHKQYDKFSFLEQIKLNLLVGILFDKKVFVLDLLDVKFDSNSQVILINDIKNLIKDNYPSLIITNNVDNISLIDDDSYVYFALESKTIEYAFKKEIDSNSLVPLVQKLIKKEDISQEDLDLLLDLDGKLVEILPNHFILANSNQVLAYKRLMSYQQHLEDKKSNSKIKENKNNEDKLSKQEADKIAADLINDVVSSSKESKKTSKKENKVDTKKENKPSQDKKVKPVEDKSKDKNIKVEERDFKQVQGSLFDNESSKKTYLIEKRQDGKWGIFLSNSNKTIKLFANQKEATDYAKNLASKSSSEVFIKSSKGSSKGKFNKI